MLYNLLCFFAQYKLNEREGKLDSTEYSNQDAEEEQKVEEFQPNEDDVVSNYNDVENRDILEKFIEVARENRKNNESEIRVVTDKEKGGVIIYDLKSRYDQNANQGWIDVTSD